MPSGTNRDANLIITPKTSASIELSFDQISTLLYIIEGYCQGDDYNQDDQFASDCDNLIEILEQASETIPLDDDPLIDELNYYK
tara:strand:- start:23125 stop:23376 length:252 start_codon:yes stop_codon:yes gene_type:complete